jgi:PKD repeat protein
MKNPVRPKNHHELSFYMIALFLLYPFFTVTNCQTTIEPGSVSGIWSKEGSPYIITGPVSVDNNQSLVILPGVEIRLNKDARISVYNEGSLVAEGSKDSLILFTSNEASPLPGDWEGINLWGTSYNCRFKHVIVEYAIRGIGCFGEAWGCQTENNFSKIDSCIFRYNSNSGIHIFSYGSDFYGCLPSKTGRSNPEIRYNLIHNNGNGIYMAASEGYYAYGYVGANILNNVIYSNLNNGIYCEGDDPVEPKIINNTIVNNSEKGIFYHGNFDSVDFKIVNNIIADNDIGIYSNDSKGANIIYNDIWGNNSNYEGLDIPLTDISEDPLLLDPMNFNFNIDPLSPCIDAGDPEIMDPDGTVSDIGAFYVAQPPDADFEADIVQGNYPLTIHFSDASFGNVSSWLWTFGDESTSTEKNPTHTYATAGSFTVSLTVTGVGGTDTEIKSDFITVTVPPPVAAFTCDQTSGNMPFTVVFINNSSGDISNWSWDFGDGGTSDEQNPSHTYTAEGTFTVTLIVTGAGGADTLTMPDYITITNITGIDAKTAEGKLKIYPNPARLSCSVSFTIEKSGNIVLAIYDNHSKLIGEIYRGYLNTRNYTFKVDVSDLPEGLYYISLITESINSYQKIVIVK